MTKLEKNKYFKQMDEMYIYCNGKLDMAGKMLREAKEKYGCDSEQYKAVLEMVEEVQKEDPYTYGEASAYRAWNNTVEQYSDSDVIIMTDYLSEEDIAGFVVTLRNAELEKFYLTNSSTALMENIHGYIAAGCKMTGTVVLERKRWNKVEQVLGLEFTL